MKDKNKTKEQLIKELAEMHQRITELKVAQEELRESQKKFENLVNNSNDIISTADESGNWTFLSPSVKRVLGFEPAEMVGRSAFDFVFPEDIASTREAHETVVREGKYFWQYENRWVAKDGWVVTLAWNVVALRDNQGNIIGTQGVGRDITDRKKAEERIRQQIEFMNMAIESLTNPFCAIDASNYTIKLANSAAHLGKLTRTSTTCFALIHGRSEPCKGEYACPLEEVRRTKKPVVVEHIHYDKDGSKRNVEVHSYPVFDGEGNVGQVIEYSLNITERKKAEAKVQRTLKKLRRVLGATIQAMAVTVEMKDAYTAGHQRRVTDLVRAIAKEMHLSGDEIDGIRMAGSIHDIGKIGVPAEILNKPVHLARMEFELIKDHPAIGYNILKEIQFPWPVAKIVLQHHERMDGSGYPGGLSGDAILIEARILAVADAVEAMSSHRPYRPALGIDKALEEIKEKRGTLYDPEVVDACLKLFTEKGFKFKESKEME